MREEVRYEKIRRNLIFFDEKCLKYLNYPLLKLKRDSALTECVFNYISN